MPPRLLYGSLMPVTDTSFWLNSTVFWDACSMNTRIKSIAESLRSIDSFPGGQGLFTSPLAWAGNVGVRGGMLLCVRVMSSPDFLNVANKMTEIVIITWISQALFMSQCSQCVLMMLLHLYLNTHIVVAYMYTIFIQFITQLTLDIYTLHTYSLYVTCRMYSVWGNIMCTSTSCNQESHNIPSKPYVCIQDCT